MPKRRTSWRAQSLLAALMIATLHGGLDGCGSSSGGGAEEDAGVDAGPSCAGAPPCASGCSVCDETCVDLSGDPRNCGTCATVCNPGLSCAAGTCALVCAHGETKCGAACADLTADDANCGACGEACPTGAACVGSRCVTPTVLASGLSSPGGIAVDSTHVYFGAEKSASEDQWAIESVPVAGGAVKTLGGALAMAAPLAVDGSGVYWGSSAGMFKIPLAGGTTEALAPSGSSIFAIDATSVYWLGFDGSATVDKVPLAGSKTATSLAPFSSIGGVGLAVSGDYVYWANYGSMTRIPLAGGSSTQVTNYTVTVDANVSPLVTNGTSGFYFLNYDASQGDTQLVTVSLGTVGGTAQMTDVGAGPNVVDLRADDEAVYFLDAASSSVDKIPVGGGTVSVLAEGQSHPVNLTIDATSVYWVNAGTGLKDGSVMKIPK